MVDDDSKNRASIAELIVELYKLQPKFGYFLLYYLRARYLVVIHLTLTYISNYWHL